jgi:hypothetical protein
VGRVRFWGSAAAGSLADSGPDFAAAACGVAGITVQPLMLKMTQSKAQDSRFMKQLRSFIKAEDNRLQPCNQSPSSGQCVPGPLRLCCELDFNPHIAPVSGMRARVWCGCAQGWVESHSCGYGL